MQTAQLTDDFLLDTIKNRHAIIRGVYFKMRQAEPMQKVEDVVREISEKSGYNQRTVFNILRG